MAATDASAAAADAHNPQAVAQARAAHAQAVAAWIARHKVYPDRARRRGQHGTAVLLLELTGAGGVRAARIADSSGHAALDRAVLDLVRRAAPFPAAPTVLGGQVLSFRVPVRFTLR